MTFGYPSELDFRIAYRVKPSISQSGERVVVDAATAALKTYSSSGGGAFSAPVAVHDGDAPDLSTTDLAFGYTDIGDSVSFSVPATRTAGAIYTTGDMSAAVQSWFDRAGYASDDYLAVIWEGGDSTKDEYVETYQGNAAAQADRCRVNCTYHKASKAQWNGVANANIRINGAGSDNLNPLQ
jgi:hypothetical protein